MPNCELGIVYLAKEKLEIFELLKQDSETTKQDELLTKSI